jgi:hypothetical protein
LDTQEGSEKEGHPPLSRSAEVRRDRDLVIARCASRIVLMVSFMGHWEVTSPSRHAAWTDLPSGIGRTVKLSVCMRLDSICVNFEGGSGTSGRVQVRGSALRARLAPRYCGSLSFPTFDWVGTSNTLNCIAGRRLGSLAFARLPFMTLISRRATSHSPGRYRTGAKSPNLRRARRAN